MRFCVELLPPHHTDFCARFRVLSSRLSLFRCDICDVDLPSKEISDRHFASEDHETAQVLHPLADAVQDTIDDSLMIAPAISHHRSDSLLILHPSSFSDEKKSPASCVAVSSSTRSHSSPTSGWNTRETIPTVWPRVPSPERLLPWRRRVIKLRFNIFNGFPYGSLLGANSKHLT